MTLPGVYSLPEFHFRAEISIGTGEGEAYLYDDPTSLYDTATYSANEFYWTNVSTRLISCTTTRGRDRYGLSFKAGSATFTFADEDGIFNPDATGLNLGDLRIRPGRFIRLVGKLVQGTEWIPVWTGRIDSIIEAYSGAGHNARAVFQATELASSMARDNPPALVTPVGAGELTSGRAERVLELAGFSSDDLAGRIDTGVHTMPETTLPESYWNELQNAAQAEGGAAYFGRDGLPRFRNQSWLDTGPDEGTVRLSIGGVADAVAISNDPKASWEAARVRNDIQLARVGGTAVPAVDSASQSAYGVRSFRLFDYQLETDVQVQTLADQMLAFFRYDRARLNELELIPLEGDGVNDLLELDLGWRVRVTITLATDWGYTFDAWVNRVSHELDEGGDWKVRIQVDNVDRTNPQFAGPYSSAFSDAYDPKPEPT